MKTSFITTLIGILFINLAMGQNEMDTYDVHIKAADSLYSLKEFTKSAEHYEKAFDSNDGKAHIYHRYNAACTHALAGNSKKAFYHLNYLVENPAIKYSRVSEITSDSDFNSLHKMKEWKKIIAQVEANKEEIEKDFDKPLVAMLDTIFQEDQTYRRQIQQVEDEFGRESDEMEAHWELIMLKDSINLVKVKKILDERGWLGADIIGEQGNSTLFLVIQHAPLEVQDKYLPMMREAVKDGKAQSSSLALLEDRVALRKGGRQIYGSQIGMDQETGEYFVLPLIDPKNVDKRRTEVGLGPIAEYVDIWKMSWDVEKHIERTKKYEAEKDQD